MKIGIFGGSFNPPHKMHENIAEYFIDNNILDKVIFVPTGNKYKYKNNLINDLDRFNMLKLIVSNNPNFEVSDYELKDHIVYTYETLKHFQDKYPNSEIYFICGADNLSYIDTWKNAKDILTNYKILVIKRKNENITNILGNLKFYKDNIKVVDMALNDLSSTFIRNNINSSNILDDKLNKEVYNYIIKNKLYIID